VAVALRSPGRLSHACFYSEWSAGESYLIGGLACGLAGLIPLGALSTCSEDTEFSPFWDWRLKAAVDSDGAGVGTLRSSRQTHDGPISLIRGISGCIREGGTDA
jgi:hypothetical protein